MRWVQLLKPNEMYCKAAFAASMLTLTALCARAHTGGEPVLENLSKAELNGSVYQSGSRKPISNVTITAYSANRKEMSVATDANGQYYFDGLKSGVYRFVFEHQGFRKVTREKVAIRTDEGVQINIGMDEEEEFNWLPGLLPMLGNEE